jgi:nucleoid DNA-binding protein
MRNVDFVTRLSKDANIPLLEAKVVLDRFGRILAEQLAKGDDVNIAGIGQFAVQDYTMDGKPQTMIRFRSAKDIKDAVAAGYVGRKTTGAEKGNTEL